MQPLEKFLRWIARFDVTFLDKQRHFPLKVKYHLSNFNEAILIITLL